MQQRPTVLPKPLFVLNFFIDLTPLAVMYTPSHPEQFYGQSPPEIDCLLPPTPKPALRTDTPRRLEIP